MRYLITGITGFVGPHLANLLVAEGHEAVGLIRCSNGRENDIRDVVTDEIFNQIKFVYGDLINSRAINQIFKKEKFDGVFHLAAQSHPPTSFVDPIGTFESNIIGSANLVEAILDNQPECKLHFCSTSEVYGNIGIDQRKITENDLLLPVNPYGISKLTIDLFVQERFKSKNLKGFVTRAFSHCGQRRGMNFSISSDAYQIARMMCCYQDRILKVGNLESVRVVLDVRDIVNAYYLLMLNDKSNGEVFNISGDIPYKMEYYTDVLIKLSGLRNIKKEIYPPYYRPIDINYQHGDCSKLKNIVKWEPKHKIEETLNDLLRYWFDKIS